MESSWRSGTRRSLCRSAPHTHEASNRLKKAGNVSGSEPRLWKLNRLDGHLPAQCSRNPSGRFYYGTMSIFLVGVEGASHHGLLAVLPELNMLCLHLATPECLRIQWNSFPEKSNGMSEAARIALIWGDSCARKGGGWISNCARAGTWRCPKAEDMYRELLWRFGTWPNLVTLPDLAAPGIGGGGGGDFRSLVLRRDFLRAVYSHASKPGSAWDGSLEAHALVLAAHTTLLSVMLARLPRDAWRSFDPDLLSAPAPSLRTACLRALAAWLHWGDQGPPTMDRGPSLPSSPQFTMPPSLLPPPSDEALLGMLARQWRGSRKDPAASLPPAQLAFVGRLAAARRADGSWASLEDPDQVLIRGALHGVPHGVPQGEPHGVPRLRRRDPGGSGGGPPVAAAAATVIGAGSVGGGTRGGNGGSGNVGGGAAVTAEATEEAAVEATRDLVVAAASAEALRAALVEAGGRLEDYSLAPFDDPQAPSPQSVAWPLATPHTGPFPEACPRPPDWDNLDSSWPQRN